MPYGDSVVGMRDSTGIVCRKVVVVGDRTCTGYQAQLVAEAFLASVFGPKSQILRNISSRTANFALSIVLSEREYRFVASNSS